MSGHTVFKIYLTQSEVLDFLRYELPKQVRELGLHLAFVSIVPSTNAGSLYNVYVRLEK
jgi:hypothetical protein